MNRVLEGLKPAKVFRYFEDLTRIPHGSKNTKAISDYCVEFAKSRGLEYYQDEMNNIVLIKEATEGYEDAPAVIVQGHLDMVCVKEENVELDFMKDPLDLAVKGDYIYARGTSLRCV